jgi:hypothetical protein
VQCYVEVISLGLAMNSCCLDFFVVFGDLFSRHDIQKLLIFVQAQCIVHVSLTIMEF